MKHTEEHFELANSVINMIKMIARRITKKNHMIRQLDLFDDLVQSGYIGVLQAAVKYEPDKGKFTTYAYPYAEGYMKNTIRSIMKDNKRRMWGSCAVNFLDKITSVEHYEKTTRQSYDDISYQLQSDEVDNFIQSVATDNQKFVFDLYFKKNYNMNEIAAIKGVTRQSISCTIMWIVKKIREWKPDWINGESVLYRTIGNDSNSGNDE